MVFLGIETSCDETSAAVMNSEWQVLSNIVLSQDEIHAPYGGVVPELASRQHIRSISFVVDETLARSGLSLDKIDGFAVTQGPGLIGSLLVGLSYAKGLAYCCHKPLYPIDHLEAHIHSAFIENRDIAFPVLALLVSGGHTSLFFMKEKFSYELIAKTRDDAAGEALDKIAKFLDLGYPGGPVIDRLAEKGDPKSFAFTLPQMSDGSLDFSFSGFKTAALRHIRAGNLNKDHARLNDFLASFENGIIRALLSNLEKAANSLHPRSLILSGGVARNRKLRKRFEESAGTMGLNAYVPAPIFCTDNAAMITALAIEKSAAGFIPELDMTLNAYARRISG